MARTYYKLICRLHGADRFLLWFTDEHDGLIATPDERVFCFSSELALGDYAQTIGVELSEHRPVLHDFDAVQTWLRTPSPEAVESRRLLSAWNLLLDLARSTPTRAQAFVKAEANLGALYDKLFLASSPTLQGSEIKPSEPKWTEPEVANLVTVMRSGLELLQGVLLQAK